MLLRSPGRAHSTERRFMWRGGAAAVRVGSMRRRGSPLKPRSESHAVVRTDYRA
jgi:hypothetical protein